MQPATPLAPWTYTHPDLLPLELDAVFAQRWQFVGHRCEVPGNGDFITATVGRDNVIVMRGKDAKLRSFLNVCRHRASRLLEGNGNCSGVLQCPYHQWTYRLDGSLMSMPQPDTFGDVNKDDLGLYRVQLEEFHGFLFVRIRGNGPTVAEQFAHTAHYFEQYETVSYECIAPATEEIWSANWKVVWDNYQENYHIPFAHKGLHRLVKENDVFEELESGIGFSEFELRDKVSSVNEERRYQKLVHHADKRVPESIRKRWVQFGYSPNLGIDLYAELVDIFQVIPLSTDKTLIRTSFYGHRNATPEEQELRRLNFSINAKINDEDKVICRRVQQGLSTQRYSPGPFSSVESGVLSFHQLLKEQVPVMQLQEPPRQVSLAERNAEMPENQGT
ncbi:MAG: aromatic ring-hydroxylating dioxygenase subunit alpha [Pseudomonadota bacterium]